jgi:signal recognition particle receptor subunit beta
VTYVNYAAREINIKIVYYGPGLGGKTTNLKFIFEKTAAGQKGKLISLATETDRTLFFDFMPLDLGSIQGFKTRLHLYTVPGQVFYNASRKLILKGVDGIVQVVDSQPERMDANYESIENLQDNLKEHGYDLETIPYLLQLNKRDVANAMPVEQMVKELQLKGEPVIEAIATDGTGVFQSLKAVSKMVLVDLRKRLI